MIRALVTTAAAAAAVGAIFAAPMAAAAPNENGTSHADERAQTGLSRAAAGGANGGQGSGGVAGAAGNGPGPVLSAVQVSAPSQAQDGLGEAICVVAEICEEEATP
ncbi:hypothetical protein [Mycolicibacterium pyrenivorans]|uniref:hypothetical protein n=1 Tax=Mycolicibacterium pyrenivorans TaxID=187102 RepID=UPI0021F2EAC8|nr:hypothetical protein [Mycolicibacterium pyrenivorans]MCV7152828.1 hypothetical protein [Mycolicibacterium pyrenivorans]